jgi:hypothetical protein
MTGKSRSENKPFVIKLGPGGNRNRPISYKAGVHNTGATLQQNLISTNMSLTFCFGHTSNSIENHSITAIACTYIGTYIDDVFSKPFTIVVYNIVKVIIRGVSL